MKRFTIATLWVAGTTVPVLMATVFLAGCCVLPFHGVMHKLMPICHLAADLMRGDHADGHAGDASVPASPKQEPVRRIVSETVSAVKLIMPMTIPTPAAILISACYRSFVTLGAVRCDDDVGHRLALLDMYRV